MGKIKRKVVGDSVPLDLKGHTLKVAKEIIEDFIAKYGEDAKIIEVTEYFCYECGGTFKLEVSFERRETDQELALRQKQHDKNLQKKISQKEKRRQQYLKLKKEFEDD